MSLGLTDVVAGLLLIDIPVVDAAWEVKGCKPNYYSLKVRSEQITNPSTLMPLSSEPEYSHHDMRRTLSGSAYKIERVFPEPFW